MRCHEFSRKLLFALELKEFMLCGLRKDMMPRLSTSLHCIFETNTARRTISEISARKGKTPPRYREYKRRSLVAEGNTELGRIIAIVLYFIKTLFVLKLLLYPFVA
jgi:hypothetical protein